MNSECDVSQNNLNISSLSDEYTLTKTIDSIFWTTLIFFITFIATVKDMVFATFPYLACLPLVYYVFLSFRLPVNYLNDRSWRKNITVMKFFALVAVFNFPFIVFWSKGTETNHTVWCTIISIYAILKMLQSSLWLIRLLSEKHGDKTLFFESRIAIFTLNLSILISLTLFIIYKKFPLLLNLLIGENAAAAAIRSVLLILIIFPIIFPITLLYRIRVLMVDVFKSKLEKVSCQKLN